MVGLTLQGLQKGSYCGSLLLTVCVTASEMVQLIHDLYYSDWSYQISFSDSQVKH